MNNEDKTKKKILNFIKENLKWIIAIICICILAIIIRNIFNDQIQNFDESIYSYISTHISTNTTIVMKIITEMVSPIALCTICIAMFVFVKNKKVGLLISLNLIISTLLNIVIKNIFERPRPDEYRLTEVGGFSFPSGHSMASMAFYGFLIYLICKKIKNKYVKYSLTIILSILIFAIGTSRVYLGVHYASDVIGGFLFSIIYLIFYTHFTKKIIKT